MPPPLHFGTQLDQKLIKLVRENPLLYNPDHPVYSSSDAKELTWQKISDALGRSTQRCKSRWLNIRDQMRRNLRLRIEHPEEKLGRKYRYEDDLQFLVPHFKQLKSGEDLSELVDDIEQFEDPHASYRKYKEDDSQLPHASYRTHEEDNQLANASYRSEEAGNQSDVETVYQDLNPKDPLDVFLMAIGSSLRKFSPLYLNQAKTAEFAGIQCHIQFGDYHEEKHKPGFIENLSEYLPEQYCSAWSIEKKILKEYSTHAGLNELEAKHLYTKTARALPTYGVTFFLVKEKQKGKKKLVPRLLGINADAVLRLDETSKEVIQTWPLTHVKTYHAGKGETFTLNFGDYTDKEYSVKTRDAFRIRDILEGYIDLIRKRMLAQYNISTSEHGYVGQDNISYGQASTVQHISSNAGKAVEHSFVGPSKIVEYEPGQVASQGTQMGTAQQMIINEMKNKQDQGVLKAEVGMRQDMGVPFTRRLNRLNSNSVKIVTLLTEPSQAHLEDAQKIVDGMNAEMPSIKDGVTNTIAKQTSEEEKKKLQDQLHELDELMRTLSECTNPASPNASEAEDAAKRVATLSTEMYFALAPETRRRSRILSKSRASFIADDKTEKNLRRASFIAASATANHALDSAAELAQEAYKGPALSPQDAEALEQAAVDKLGKINAAIAHYMLAHSDPRNVDYATAVNSMNTIHELMPDLARDAQALASLKDGKDRSALINDIQELCAAAKHICSLSGVEDTEKLQEASSKYADVSGRLVYVFGRRGAQPRADKENQLLELAEAVVDKTSVLLNSTQGLTALAAAEPAAADVNDAGAATATAAKNLHAQAVLNAPTIAEPHCQSALTAASEALSSSAQQLAASWKPLVEPPSRHVLGEKLHNQTMDLAKALDKLTDAYGGPGDSQGVKATKPGDEAQRLKFITTLSKVGGDWKPEDDLNKPLTSAVSDAEAQEAQRRLSGRIAQLNAALAALLAATSDRENPDYGTAEAAIATINELMPELVKDTKTASANQDDASKAALLDDIQALCAATRNVCASAHGAEPEGLNEALIKFTNSSGKLTYVCNRRANPDREAKIIDATSAACAQAGVLLSGVQQLSEGEGGEVGQKLDAQGAALADAAQSLLTTAQVTASSISDSRCQSALLASIDKVSSISKGLEDSWAPLKENPKLETRLMALQAARRQLEKQLDKLRALSQLPDKELQSTQDLQISEGQSLEPQVGWKHEGQSILDGAEEQQKLKFITTMRGANEKLAHAQEELKKPTMLAKGADTGAVRQRLTQGLEQLNAAVAALLAATADRENPNCTTAGQAADTITKLMPQLIKDTKTVSATMDEPARAAMLAEVKALCDASQGICASSYGADSAQQNVNDAVAKFADASGKLVFVANPRRTLKKKDEIVNLASAASAETSALLAGVQALAGGAGGARGRALDAAGGRLAVAAQNMLQSAQILSPSLPSKQCQEALVATVDNASSAGQQLAAAVAPLQDDPKHSAAAKNWLQALQRLHAKLDALKAACEAPGSQGLTQEQEQQKLHFINTVEAAKGKWADAQKELKKPVTPARGADVGAIESRLSQRLAALDAAVAALLAATADSDNPNYAGAEKAATTISELLPHVVQDTKTVCASKDEPARAAMMAEIKALCDASQGICASSYGEDPKGLNDAVAKFADASGKLVFVVNPRKNLQKQNEIINLASAACGDTSALLAGVQQLAEGVGGARGQELDAQGGRLAAQAQNLLQTVEITAPSLTSPECRSALLSSVDSVSSAGQQLAASVAPLQNDPKHSTDAKNALQALQRLHSKLDALKAACEAPASGSQGLSQEQEQQKLHFIKTVEAAKGKWADAQKELKKPVTPARGADVGAIESRLSQRLAALDAAVAALLAATADPDNPNYAAAEKAATTISELLPHVVQDTKTVCASKDEPARAAMMAEIKALCDASQGICASSYGEDPKSLNDAVAKFADASGKLVFVVNPRKNLQKQNEVINLASSACGDTSALLAGVQQLAEGVGGARGQELDAQGGRLAAQAQNLLQTVEITAPSLTSPECRSALLSSVDSVSSAGQQLAASVAPLQNDPKHSADAKNALQALQRMHSKLDALKAACEAPASGSQVLSQEQEQQKLHFIKTVEAAKGKWADAQKELKKPVTSARGADVGAIESRLSQRLAALDAAVAALLAATADPDKPNYAGAEKAATTISELLPHVIQDTKTVCASKDEPARAAMMAEIKALCDASQGICASSYGEDPKNLNDAVAKFADASAKLVFVVNPRKNLQKQNEIVNLASAACGDTSALLAGVQQLAEGVGGARGQELDAQGGRLAAQAQNLLQTVEVTAPSLTSPECRSALLSSVDSVSSASQQLAASVAPLQDDSKHSAAAKNAMQALQRLHAKLDALKAACEAPGTKGLSQEQEQQKLHFIKTVEAAKGKWADAQKELKKPVTPARGADVGAIESRLSQRLAALDAAVAALLAATADPDKPDFAAAEKASTTILELLPHVIQDTKTVCASKDEPARAAMMAEIKALCDASQAICASSYGEDPKSLNNAVAKFADSSAKLVFVVNPRKNLQKQNEIVKLASAACGETSTLLAGVQQLAEGVGGARGQELDAQGGRLAAQAQNLLQTVEITAPSLTSPECRSALLSSADSVSSAGQQLAASVAPLQNDPKHSAAAKNALQALQRLHSKLDALKAACDAPGSQGLSQEQEHQKQHFIKTVEAAEGKWVDAQKELKKPVTPARGADVGAIESRLSQRLAALDAAVAALLAATSDRDKPQYAEAEKSVKTISELMPHIIQDTKTVCASKDEPARAAMLAEVKALCDASQGICASSYGVDPQGLNDAVAKFSEASGKLVYVANPRVNAQKEKEVVDQAGAACGSTAALLSGVQLLAEGVGGAQGRELDAQGGRVADAAQNLLHAAQITAPSLSSPECRAALLSSVDTLSQSADQLSQSLTAVGADSKLTSQANKLHAALKQLQDQLDKLRETCNTPVTDSQVVQEQQKQQSIKTVEASKGKWADVQKELKKPVTPARGADVGAIESRLSQRLAALDAAVAALLAATADRDKPQYAEAEKSVKTISELLPHIIQDSKTVCASKDEPARAAMLAEVKALCDASQGICASSYGVDPQGLNDAVAKFSEASGKLVFVANPRVNAQKEKEVVDQAGAACGSTAALLSGVQALAEGAGGARGRALDAAGGRVADAAQNLLHTAQITAPSLSSPDCRAALLSSVDSLSQSVDQLSHSLTAVSADSKLSSQANKLHAALKQLQDQLDRLRKTCNAPDTAPPVAGKKPPPLPATKPPSHVAHAPPHPGGYVNITQDFLEKMRSEEGMGRQGGSPASPAPAVVGGLDKARARDDDQLRPAFLASIEHAEGTIKKHESALMKQCRSQSGSGPALSQRDMMQKQVQLQRHLAQAGVEVASLVAANYADKIDYTAASKSTKALPILMTSIVEEGTQLSDNLNDMARKAFLYDMLQACEAARKLCHSAGTDRQKLNDAAVHFGDTSTKLLYVVSNDVDPALEKEIISRAKAIGDSASRVALEAANVATAASGATSVQDICDAGTACVDAAGKLVYTAKLTAPSIHERACQDALVASTDTLSSKLKSFAGSWKPLESDPQQAKTISHLSAEAVNLEKILEGLRSDVREGNIGRRRELEQLVIEDTPMRQLTVKILDEAKAHAESSTLQAQQKIAYAAYADKLTEALRALDLANARCKKTPHDTDKRRDLEAAIQNLLMILLQSRPSRGDKGKTNIVDLMDFMEEVACEAKNVSSAASTSKVPTPQDKRTLEEIKEQCDKIEAKANQLIRGEVASDLDFNDLFDQFGQECDDVIKQITSEVKGMEDVKAKKLLQSKAMALSESCNMLRFATKSGISTEACASLDAALDELDDIEDRVIGSIVQEAQPGVTLRGKPAPRGGHSPASINLCREVASSSGVAPAAVTAYIADAASRADTTNPDENNKLLKHLYKLVHLLKTLTVASSARAATWQPADGPDTARLTDQILQEIYNPECKFGVKADDKQRILDDDIAKLLIPSAPRILGDHKQQEVKLTQLASELSAQCGGLSRDASAATLGRAARAAADTARDLDGVARGAAKTDPVQRRKIDEAAKEMSFCTYNVLKTAESACLEPKNLAMKRRLADALLSLNHSIDKLVWHASSAPVLQRQCGALSRGAAAQLAALQPQPHSAATFSDTCDLIAQQGENISKLKSDQPMPRKEFMRNLDDIGTAVRSSVEGAAHCAYYIAVSDQHKDVAKVGIADVPKIQLALESIQDSCMAIISANQYDQAKEQKEDLHKRVLDFSNALDQAQLQVKDTEVKRTLVRAKSCVSDAAAGLEASLERQNSLDKVTPQAVSLLEAVSSAHGLVERCPLVPAVGNMSKETKEKCDEVMNHSKTLLSHTLALLKDVNSAPEEPEMMTWVTFDNRKKLLDAYDALLKSVRRNGHRVGIYEKAPEEEKEVTRKSYIETQVDLANKWLKSPACKTEVKVTGQQAARNVVDMARQLSEDLKGSDREEVRNMITETEELLSECGKKYDHEKNSLLMDRLKELRKCIQRGVVTRVVEDFIEAEAPLSDLDLLADIEQDETKRKFILERKIASLLAQLGRVTKTARFVATASQQQNIGVELTSCSEQTELLAPLLVKAAQLRIDHPDDKAVVEKYKALLAQYAESIARVRDLCDRAVDPMDFVQTAGDTMQRMREDMTQSSSDPQKCAYNSGAITKLANRVIHVSMSSNAVASDPELQKALIAAKQRLHAVTPAPDTRASRLPDWRDTTAEILRTTGDVEQALGGENIFKKEPTTANQPIYSVASDLYESVREWSSRDNEIVGVARRMAVLMARLSEYMETDKKEALIATSKSIVLESHEVAELAKKLAHECSDVRIKTNLLQTCERIPTISGQLKMLTTVKASSLGQQGVEADKEAMDMLVGNAQSLMLSIQEVVKAAAGASVKIMSQRGPRLRWVRKNYY